jgi:hypothetical protein
MHIATLFIVMLMVSFVGRVEGLFGFGDKKKREKEDGPRRSDVEAGLETLRQNMNDPQAMRETLEMLKDPEVMAEVKRMQSDPAFIKDMEKLKSDPRYRESVENAREKAQQFAAKAAPRSRGEGGAAGGERTDVEIGLQGLAQAANDPDALRTAFEALQDPDTQADVKRMMSDPKFRAQMEQLKSSPQFQAAMDNAREKIGKMSAAEIDALRRQVGV